MKVNVKANQLEATTNNVKGLCTVTFGDSFAVRNISIVESKKGGTFVSMNLQNGFLLAVDWGAAQVMLLLLFNPLTVYWTHV